MSQGSGIIGNSVGIATVMDGVIPKVLGDLNVKTRIIPDFSQGTIALPPGTAIDKPRIDGTDLVLMQPDGSAVVIEDGATFPGALVVDGQTIPVTQMVASATGTPVLEPAAPPPEGQGGPEEPLDGGGRRGAHPNFQEFNVPDLGPGLTRSELVPPVTNEFDVPKTPPLEPGVNPPGSPPPVVPPPPVTFCVEGDTCVAEGCAATFNLGYHGEVTGDHVVSIVLNFEYGTTEPVDFAVVNDTLFAALQDAAEAAGVGIENLGNGQVKLTFDANSQTNFDFTIPTLDDAQLEGVESFRIVLSDASPGDTIQCEDVTTDIKDDDCIVFTICGDDKVCEGDCASYTVGLGSEDDGRPHTIGPGETASVDVHFDFGSAESEDFAANLYDHISAQAAAAGVGFELLDNGDFRLTFSETSQIPFNFTVHTVDDCKVEGYETYNISLVNPVSSTGCEAEVDCDKNDVCTTIKDNDQDLQGKLLINEIGVKASEAACITIGCETFEVPCGKDFIEIRNFADCSITDKSLDQVKLQVSNGCETVTLDLSTRDHDGGLGAGESIVLYETGLYVIYDSNGEPKQAGYFDAGCEGWPMGCDTSDPLAVSMYQTTCEGCTPLDGFLANGVDPDSVRFGETIWVGDGEGSNCTQKLLGDFANNNTFNGAVGNVAATVAALGLLVPTVCAASDGVSNQIYARVNSPENPWGGAGDTDTNGNPIPADTDRAADWTTVNVSTEGRLNNSVDPDINPVDPHDNLNPFQGDKSGEDIGRDPALDGQTVIDATMGGQPNDEGTIAGSRGPDFLYGDANDNTLRGGDHNDFLMGGGGNDWLFGEAGGDLVIDVKGSDHLYGGTGDDILITDGAALPGFCGLSEEEIAECTDVGNSCVGGDWLDGGMGDDILIAGGSADDLKGGSGDDFLNGGAGADQLSGGSGSDTFFFDAHALADAQAGISDFITDYDNDDSIDLSSLFDIGDLSNLDQFVSLDGNKLLVDATGSGDFSEGHAIAIFTAAQSSVNLVLDVDGSATPVSVAA